MKDAARAAFHVHANLALLLFYPGIFATLDEELFVPKGSEQGFVAKLAKSRANDKRLIPNKWVQQTVAVG